MVKREISMKLEIITRARREIQIGAGSKKCGTRQIMLVKFENRVLKSSPAMPRMTTRYQHP
jgi:hypothetical protein